MQNKVTRAIALMVINSLFFILSGCVSHNHRIHTVKGLYIWGPEVREFSACNGSPAIWAEGDDKVMTPIISAATEESKKTGLPWRPVYVEMDIQSLSGMLDGFAENYPAAADIIKVYRVSPDIPEDCHKPGEDKSDAIQKHGNKYR
ncbi:hypothetical protein V5268_005243 [Escherichia coli]|uniref:hypothetical protein n=1 Tax=Escherichia coli TaxID=562 RepID=UPI001481FB88|nr:hypothetical protein [Escherichia coli]MBC6572365.1 hypothetical protein [Escherichia coli]MCX1961019.1 hypothetical protein [Escherichia coli]HDB9939186.1 hypothetical protein [Escherichia coli]